MSASSTSSSSSKERGISLDKLHRIVHKRRIKRKEKDAEREDNCLEKDACGPDKQPRPMLPLSDEVENNIDAVSNPELDDDEVLPVLDHASNLRKTPAVQQYLPDWISMHSVVSADIASESQPLSDFMLPMKVKENLKAMGVDKLFPIQAAVIPEMLKSTYGVMLACSSGLPPNDLCVCAPTGCGKTLCYVIPIVCALMSRHRCTLAALVVVPSQELAVQVCDLVMFFTCVSEVGFLGY